MDETMELLYAVGIIIKQYERLEPGEMGINRLTAARLYYAACDARVEIRDQVNDNMTTDDLKFALGID